MKQLTLYTNANRERLTRALVTPSYGSLSASLLFAFLLLVLSNWSYVTPDNPIYVYLFGANGLASVLEGYADSLRFVSDILNNTSSYYAAVLIVALLIGFLVYIFLEGADHIADSAKEEVHEVTYVHDPRAKQRVKRGVIARISLRAVTSLVLVCHIVCLLKLILPYSLVLGHIDMLHFWSWNSLGSMLGSTVLLVLALHIGVIILRLLMLRPRVFGRVIR